MSQESLHQKLSMMGSSLHLRGVYVPLLEYGQPFHIVVSIPVERARVFNSATKPVLLVCELLCSPEPMSVDTDVADASEQLLHRLRLSFKSRQQL